MGEVDTERPPVATTRAQREKLLTRGGHGLEEGLTCFLTLDRGHP